MDITVCVMLPPRGATDYTTSAHPKWRVLEPVSVTVTGDTSQPITAQRTGYIHVNNVPQTQLGVVAGRLCNQGEIHKKEWCGDSTMLPPPMRSQLLLDRQITLTWGQFKAFFSNGSRAFSDEDIA
jgi:hypothetical protein